MESVSHLKLSVSQAAWLMECSEKTIRNKIRSGKLPATPSGPRDETGQTGPSLWLIDIEDLKSLPGVTLDPGRLAVLVQKHGEPLSPASLQDRLESLESVFEEMEQELVLLRRRVQALEEALASEGSFTRTLPFHR